MTGKRIDLFLLPQILPPPYFLLPDKFRVHFWVHFSLMLEIDNITPEFNSECGFNKP